jgi:hypothetical protein
MKQVYLTLGAIVRDQEHYIKEWLTFHHLIGVERFVIVLHECIDKTEEKIKELPFEVHIHHVTSSLTLSVQMGVYRWIIQEYGLFSCWLLFVDSDEYFFGTKEDRLPEILVRYEQYGGLAAHWVNFGHCNNILRPGGLSIEAFTKKIGYVGWISRVIKCAVQTRDLIALLSPHRQLTVRPVVREHFDELEANDYQTAKPATWDIIRCNHYHIRSMEDWVERCRRGSCNTIYESRKLYNVNRFIQRSGDVEDTVILRFATKIKEIVQ